jgi:hypothetical protein
LLAADGTEVRDILMRFRVGEDCFFAISTTVFGMPYVNTVVTVVDAGAIKDFFGGLNDYEIQCLDGMRLVVKDWQLQKLNPPEEPIALTRTNTEEMPKEWANAWDNR